MSASVLADTSALLAMASRSDQYHLKATDIGRRHFEAGGRFVGTTLVLAELHARLLFRRGPEEARDIIGSLLEDRLYDWVDATVALVRSARSAWLERFADQRFSLADAVSFEVMRRQGLTTAFAFDDDFVTAGFEVLR